MRLILHLWSFCRLIKEGSLVIGCGRRILLTGYLPLVAGLWLIELILLTRLMWLIGILFTQSTQLT